MRYGVSAVLVLLASSAVLGAQGNNKIVKPLVTQTLANPAVVNDELLRFMMKHVTPLTLPATTQQWELEAAKMRATELERLYHGWPKEWVNAAPKFERVSVIERKGYRIVKMRYEVVPGMWSAALLYEPEHVQGKMPAILNVNGHGFGGKAVEHKQKRCINQARRGILALNIEWFGFGELGADGYGHGNARFLDAAGVNGTGLFYLEMRRGLDYLYNHPNVDRARIGMTGVSGGGWQTIMLSGLDQRVTASLPVAGFSSLTTTIEHQNYSGGDPEQDGSDLRNGVDYPQFVAMRAPQPTLELYNDMDDCCFRAGVVKQGVYTDVKPFYALYGKAESLQWGENQDPGTHNYQIENREASYRFFDSVFHLDVPSKEDDDTDGDVLSAEDLTVGLPKENLTILSLAQSLAKGIHHEVPKTATEAWAGKERERLRDVVRYTPVEVTHAWVINSTHENRVESHSYRFEFSNGLSGTGILFQSTLVRPDAPVTVLIADAGMATLIDDIGNDINRGHRVLVFDPVLFGGNFPGADLKSIDAPAQMMSTLGERPLGIEAAQVHGVIRWLAQGMDEGTSTPRTDMTPAKKAVRPVQMVTTGPRSESVAMVAAALEPGDFASVQARKSIASFGEMFERPGEFNQVNELFCLDIYKDFDLNILAAMAPGVKVNLAATAPARIFWH